MPATCYICKKSFNSGNRKIDENSLKQHMQSHNDRNTPCPICNIKKFQNGAGATQHVESGACMMCPGKEDARKKIFEFFKKHRITRQFLTTDALTYIDVGVDTDWFYPVPIPTTPYECKGCKTLYRNASSLLQHLPQKHNNKLRIISVRKMLE